MPTNEIPSAVQEFTAGLARPRPMRRGSVSERLMKCGRKECRCQHDPQARHGPYYSLTRAEGGKTKSRYLSAEQAEQAREQVEAGHQFRERLESYWRACEQWADVELDITEATSQDEGKKGASKPPSKRKSSRRSKRS